MEMSIKDLQDQRARLRDLIASMGLGVANTRGPQREQLLRRLARAREDFNRVNRQLVEARSKR